MNTNLYGYLYAALRQKFEVNGKVINYDYDKKEWIVDIQGVYAIQPYNKNIPKFKNAPEMCVGKSMPFIVYKLSKERVEVSHLKVFLIRKKGRTQKSKQKTEHQNVIPETKNQSNYKKYFDVRKTFEDISIGQIISGTILSISNLFAIVKYRGLKCKIQSKHYSSSIIDNGHIKRKTGDSIEAVVLEKKVFVKNKRPIYHLFLSAKQIEIQREELRQKELIDKINSEFTVGQEYPVTITTFNKRTAYINAGINVPAQILYEDLAGGRIPMDDKVFVGKEMDAVFLRYDNGILYFSTKLLAEKPYEDSLFELNTDALLLWLGITANSFTAKVTEINKKKYFNYLYADSTLNRDNDTDGLLLCDSYTGKQLFITIPKEIENQFDTGCYYSIKIKARDNEYRRKMDTPFCFTLDTDAIDEIPQKLEDPYHKLVEQTFKKQNSPSQGASLAKLLVEVGDNMYDSKERMFFELLQNADDASAGKGVEVNLESTDGYLILTHDGMPFNRPDFVSITAAARSSKPKTSKKTGYKGIGFKSVFKAYKVYLKTGGFFFKFDSENELYQDFDKFYFFVNDITDEKDKTNFLEQNREEKKAFNKIDSIPWQLLPEWVEDIPENLKRTEFSKWENVSIALAMTDATKQEYVSAINDVLSEPKFMLFLRNTNRINYRNGDVDFCLSKDRRGELVTLQSTKKEMPIRQEFLVRESESLEVSNESFENCGVNIIISKEYNSRTQKDENIFRNRAGEKIDSIPPRISDSDDTLISYAIPLDENDKYVALTSSTTLFAYLPMTETRYPFPIYINADFIMKSSREGVQSENPWNYFLFYNIGKEYVKWIAKAASTNQHNYLNLLLKKYLDEETVGMTNLSAFFNRGYKESLHNEAFILNDKAELTCMSQIMVDNTGLSDIIDPDEFCYIADLEGRRLTHKSIDISPLKNRTIFDEVEIVRSIDDKLLLSKNLKYIRNWIAEAADEERTNAYNWLIANKNEVLVKSLPLFEFGDKYYSINEVSTSEKLLFLCDELYWLKDIAEKLHLLCCEDDICKHHLYEDFLKGDYILETKKKAVDTLISQSEKENVCLNCEEKALLFSSVSKVCTELKCKNKIGDWQLFVNLDGNAKPTKKLILPTADADANTLLSDYIISTDEFKTVSTGLEDCMMPINDVYTEYIQSKWETILSRWESICMGNPNLSGKLPHIYNIVQIFYHPANAAYELEQSKGNVKAKAPLNISGQNSRYILSKDGFKTQNNVFYNKALKDLGQYNVIDKLFDCSLPTFDYLYTFESDPFKTPKSSVKDLVIKSDILLTMEEICNLLNFCQSAKEDFFSYFKITEQDNMFQVSQLGKGEWGFYSTSAELRSQVLKDCSEAIQLPSSLSSYSNMEGLASIETIYANLFAAAQGDTVRLLELQNFVIGETRTIKIKYSTEFSNLIIAPELFVQESNYTSLFKMFADLYDEDGLVGALRNNVKIKDQAVMSLCDISMQGTVTVGEAVFDMDSLFPDDNQTLQKKAGETLSAMRQCGIKKEFINELFELNKHIDPTDVFNRLNTAEPIENKEQFGFLLKFCLIKNIKDASFKIKDKNGKEQYVVGSQWALSNDCFIQDSHILSSDYNGFINYLTEDEIKGLPLNIKFYTGNDILKFTKEALNLNEKLSLLNHIYNKWDKVHKLLSDSEQRIIKSALEIDSEELIIADFIYLLKDEQLSQNLIDWISEDKDNRILFFTKELCVLDETCDTISIRKYLKGEITEPIVKPSTTIVRKHTVNWIEEKKLSLTNSQFFFIENILSKDDYSVSVDTNTLCSYIKNENIITCFSNYTIYNCQESIPYNAIFKKSNYVFHSFKEGYVCKHRNDIFVDVNCIDLDDAIIELTNKNLLDAKDYLAFRNAPKDKQYDAQFDGSMDKDLDESKRNARNSLAKEEAKKWLEEHGYTIPNGMGEYSYFEVEDDNHKHYPVVVKSFQKTIYINPNEWLELIKPNSRMILYRGHNKISVISRSQLLKFKDFLFLRILSDNFDENNNQLNDNLENIAKCLKFFERTHMVIDELPMNQFRNSTSLDDIGLYNNSGSFDNQTNDLNDIL